MIMMTMTGGKVNEKTNVKRLRMIRGQKRSIRPRAFADEEGQGEASRHEDAPSTILSSAFNTSRLADDGSDEVSSSKNVQSFGRRECERVRRRRDLVMGFKDRLIYSSVILLVFTHLFLLLSSNTIQTVSANPAIAVPPEKMYSSTGKKLLLSIHAFVAGYQFCIESQRYFIQSHVFFVFKCIVEFFER